MRAVEEAIARQVLHGGDLPTNLLELGAASEQMLTAVLAESLGLSPAPAGKLPSPPVRVLQLIAGDLALRHGIFPLSLHERTLVLATAEPLSNVVEDDLGFALDVAIEQLVAPLVRVRQAIATHYGIPLDRRLYRLVAKLDGQADPSPSTLPPGGGEAFVPRPPRPISVPVPSFGTGVPSSDTGEESPMARPVAPLPPIPPSAALPQGIESEPESAAKADPRRALALGGWLEQERKGGAAGPDRVKGDAGAAWPIARRKGPFTLEMAEQDLAAAPTTDAVLEIFFTFALQFFEFAALFVIHGDLAEGRAASGPRAARDRITGVSVPLDLPSSLSRARDRRGPLIGPLEGEGLDADFARDLDRSLRTSPAAVALIPVVVRSRAVAILYGDDGESDVVLSSLGDVISFSGLVAKAIERIALQKKLSARGAPGAGPPAAAALPPPVRRASKVMRTSGIAALAKAFTASSIEDAQTEEQPAQASPASDGGRGAQAAADPDLDGPLEEEKTLDAESPFDIEAISASLLTTPQTGAVEPEPRSGVDEAAETMPRPAVEQPAGKAAEPAPRPKSDAPAPSSPASKDSEDAPITLREHVEDVDPDSFAHALTEVAVPAVRSLDDTSDSAEGVVSQTTPELRLIELVAPEETEPGVQDDDTGAPPSPRRDEDGIAPGSGTFAASAPDTSTEPISGAVERVIQREERAFALSSFSRVFGPPPDEDADERSAPAPESASGPTAAGGVKPVQRGPLPLYEGRPKAQVSTLDPLPRTSPPNATAWTSFPTPSPPPLPVRLPLSDRPIPREEQDEAMGTSTAPPSDVTDVTPLSPRAPPSSLLPSVIVDIGAEYTSLLVRVIEGGAGSHEAFNDLVRNGEQVIQALMARFPGPLRVDRHRARAEIPAASQCGPLLELIVGIRRPALPFISVRTSSPDVETRFWATHVLGELRYPEAANVLVPRLFDDDASVRRIARRSAAALVSAGAAGAPILQGLDNITRNPDHPGPQRILAIETMGEIRVGALVPPLMAVLSDPSEDVGDAARRALLMITRQDFGRDPRRWQDWWSRNAGRHRIEWLMDALMHEQPSLRRAAGDELKLLTKEYFGYYDDLPKKERERAQALYREWWEREGASRFTP